MGDCKVIVIGSSAGGISALQELISTLPADFKIPIFIVQHVSAHIHSYLPEILNRISMLRAVHPADGEKINPGHIYIAPPDYHMLIEKDHILVKKGPKENRFRPSIDALFRSAAYTFGSGATGIILTGMLDDGTSGMWSINRMQGMTIVQAPENAMYSSMPQSVLQYVKVDHILSIAQISDLMASLKYKPIINQAHVQENKWIELLKTEIGIAAQDSGFKRGILKMGEPSSLTCPECGGALASFIEDKLIRYRCHTGHAYTSNALLDEVTETVEKKLYQALRSLEEILIVLDQAGSNLKEGMNGSAENDFQVKTRLVEKSADTLRTLISQQLLTQAKSVDLSVK